MKSMTYKQYVKLRCTDKSGNLLKLSQLKRENPEEYNAYSASFDMAYDKIIRASNMRCAKLDGGKLITEKNILENSSVKNPDKTFEELKECWK